VTLSLTIYGFPVVWLSMLVFYFNADSWLDAQIDSDSFIAAQSFFGSIAAQINWMSTACGGLGILAGLVHRVASFLEFSEEASVTVETSARSQRRTHSEFLKVDQLDVHSPTVMSYHGHVTPSRCLIKGLSFEVQQGSGLVIDGPCSAGKSAIFRTVAGIWPSGTGSIAMPSIGNGCSFVPQTIYTNEGSLLEQVVYPSAHTSADHVTAIRCLNSVGLGYLVEHWGLEMPSSWVSHLSGGEVQRLGIARLLYHKPRFAFLDETTNALDVALEQHCMKAIISFGITPISISHRQSSWHFHPRLLSLSSTSKGAWSMKELDSDLDWQPF